MFLEQNQVENRVLRDQTLKEAESKGKTLRSKAKTRNMRKKEEEKGSASSPGEGRRGAQPPLLNLFDRREGVEKIGGGEPFYRESEHLGARTLPALAPCCTPLGMLNNHFALFYLYIFNFFKGFGSRVNLRVEW